MLRIFRRLISQNATRRHGSYSLRKRLAIAATGGGCVYLAVGFPVAQRDDLLAKAGAGVRFLRSVKIGILISIDYYASLMMLQENTEEYNTKIKLVHQRSAEKILNGCLVNGGTYIKIGQGLVSLSHILPKEYIRTLTQLQDKCLVRGEDEIVQLFLEDFGKAPEEMYKKFEKEPLAAASLAQVYKAVTKDNVEVAVKVQYIDLQKRFVSDVSTIDFLLKVAAFIHPKFDFGWILKDLAANLKQELDFLNEGKNAERCARDLKHLRYIYVPKIYWQLCSKRVLVTEFVDAIKINNKQELRENGFYLADINIKLFKAFGEQIFQTGFVHADPHPGNVMVRRLKNKTQLVLLDHGLYQELTDKDRVALSHFWKAIVLKDHCSMQKYSRALGVEDYTMLAEVLTQRPLKTSGFKLVSKLTQDELKYMSEMAQQRFDLITNTLKEMPRSLLFVVRNLNTIRAIAHDHGDPIDRYAVLARAATKTAFRAEDSVVKKIYSWPTRLHFEYYLLKNRLILWLIRTYFSILYFVGRTPDTSKLIAQMA